MKYRTEAGQCIISDSCIGRVAEAAATAEQFFRENVGVSLTVTAGVTVQRPWIWTVDPQSGLGLQWYGKGFVRSTLQRLPRLTVKKVYPLTRFTGRKSRMRMTNLFPPMFRREIFSIYSIGALRFPSCGESHIFPWRALLWGSSVLPWIQIFRGFSRYAG